MAETPGTLIRRIDASTGAILPIDLIQPLSVLALQQRERQNPSAVPRGDLILHQRLQFQQCAHARQKRRAQRVGLRQLARLPHSLHTMARPRLIALALLTSHD